MQNLMSLTSIAGARLSTDDREDLIDQHAKSQKKNTQANYDTHLKKLQVISNFHSIFITISAQASLPVILTLVFTSTVLQQHFLNHNDKGEERNPPFNPDLSVEGGLDVAVRFIQWLGQNMPGFNYRGKAPGLVSLMVQIERSYLWDMYKLILTNGVRNVMTGCEDT